MWRRCHLSGPPLSSLRDCRALHSGSGAMEHDVASVCAVACASLSLVLAMNMSRLRNKARSLGGKDQEKAFLDGPEFAKARIEFAAYARRPCQLSVSSWLRRAGITGAAQHARVHAAVLRAHAVPAHARSHVAPAQQQRCSVRFLPPLNVTLSLHNAVFLTRISAPSSTASIVATASAVLYALNALTVGQLPNTARMISSWGRYAALAGLLVTTVVQG